MANQISKKYEKVADAYAEAFKNTTRAMIVFQLFRKPEMTATEISKALDEDVDLVYYHMKSLKTLGIVSEPRVEVRGNYLEKYYSLAPEVRKRFAEVDKRAKRKWGEMAPEEFRQMLLAASAIVKSVIIGSTNQIEKADTSMIDNLKKKRNLVIGLDYYTKERYYELLDNLRISKSPDENNVSAEKDYMDSYFCHTQTQ